MNPQHSLPHILVVDNEPDSAGVVRDHLQQAGHTVDIMQNGHQALAFMRKTRLDLIILDITLPGLSGIEILRQYRQDSQVPVIMATARIEEVDRLLALELGADDYLCKPFSPRELVARVKAILRRSAPALRDDSSSKQTLLMDTRQRSATIHGKPIGLTPKEFDLLQLLSKQPGRVYARNQILQLIYANDRTLNVRAIDSHIKNLRRKLAQHAGGEEWIRSIYGVGFAFEPPEYQQAETMRHAEARMLHLPETPPATGLPPAADNGEPPTTASPAGL